MPKFHSPRRRFLEQNHKNTPCIAEADKSNLKIKLKYENVSRFFDRINQNGCNNMKKLHPKLNTFSINNGV